MYEHFRHTVTCIIKRMDGMKGWEGEGGSGSHCMPSTPPPLCNLTSQHKSGGWQEAKEDERGER